VTAELPNPRGREPALRVSALEKHFEGVTALAGVDLEVGQNETVGLLGPNGSGKTTLVNCVSGVLRPDAGRLVLFGDEIGRLSRHRRVGRGLVRTYQSLRLFASLTVAENIESGLLARGTSVAARRSVISQILDDMRLRDVAHVEVDELSYGQQRRVEVARALACRPRLLLLDEPAAGLGEAETMLLERSIEEAKKQLGCSVLIIDHDVSLVMRLSDRIIVLSDGQVLRTGTPAEIAEDEDVIRVYLGDEFARRH
jgi:branched-chain amino acid transport system ATP-binding protein